MKRLVYLSPVPYASFAQRPHHFVNWFHGRTGGEVLWIDPYPTRLPEAGDFRRLSGGADRAAHCVLPGWLQVVAPRALPIEPLPWLGRVNRLLWRGVLQSVSEFIAGADVMVCVGKPSRLAGDVLEMVAPEQATYDAMDDFPAFYAGISRWSMTRRERDVLSRVGNVLVSSTALAQRFRQAGFHPKLALNACKVDALPPLADRCASGNAPVIGYVGTLANWFDWELVLRIAENNPDASVRLTGPLFTAMPVLPQNVRIEPPCDHAAALRKMAQFTVGLIPFRQTPLTASVDPVKYYEYRALGLPVVSTRFGEMSLRGQREGVLLVGNDDPCENLVDRAQSLVPSEEEVEAFRKDNGWEVRFDAAGILR